MKLDSFIYLLADALFRVAVRWVESVVTAESASSCAYLPITIRARETCVDAYFLHTAAELAREVRGIAVETSVITPRKHFFVFCKNTKKFRVWSLKFRVVEKFKVYK